MMIRIRSILYIYLVLELGHVNGGALDAGDSEIIQNLIFTYRLDRFGCQMS